jgi:hypothetical protein
VIFLLLCILPHDTIARERCDQIEVQQVYSWSGCEKENGDVDYVLKPMFTQILFRRFDEKQGTHVIEAWRMAKPTMAYQFSHARGFHEIRWMDGELERCVETKSMVYSATDLDSEVSERTQHPKEWRRDLRRK